LGLRNTAAIVIDDADSPSLLVDGSKLIAFNCKINRKLAKATSARDILKNIPAETRTEADTQKLQKLERKISKLHAKRREFFYNQFHKISKRTLDSLTQSEVITLFVSRNLADCKNSVSGSLGKKTNQKFYQIPLLKLIDYLEQKAAEYGITVTVIDESYSSKCSAISGDINEAQAIKKQRSTQDDKVDGEVQSIGSNVLNGKRLRRSLFLDRDTQKKVHADLNAALNHIKIGLGLARDEFSHIKNHLWKLANPKKLKLHTHARNCFLDVGISPAL
jgi:IS605 OrfB family transposase